MRIQGRINLVLLFALLLSLFILPGTTLIAQTKESKRINDLYKNASSDFYKLYEVESFGKYEHNWLNTIKQFANIFRSYPESLRAPQSIYNAAKLYRSLFSLNGSNYYLKRSNANFLFLYEKYPKSYLADDALYELATNYKSLMNDQASAIKYFKLLAKNYPKSEYASAVNEEETPVQDIKAPGSERKVSSKDSAPTNSGETNEIIGTEIVGSSNDVVIDPNSKPAEITKIDYWSTSEWTRVVINTTTPVKFRYNTLAGEKTRFYIDILNSFLNKQVDKKIAANDGIIETLRASQFKPGTSRVVLDLDKFSEIKVFTYPLPSQFKIVLDVVLKGNNANKPKKGDIPTGNETNLSLQNILGLKVQRIIIDPGHGGTDPGARSGGINEKDVVLKVSKMLKDKLEKSVKGVEVLMTRESDFFVELEARTAFANQKKGDLFVSIHANSETTNSARGVETFFLNLTKDKDSLKLAAFENSSTSLNVSDLQSIINDLMINTKLRESADFARRVQSNLIKTLNRHGGKKIPDRGIKQAPFVVLLGANMPSILVEIGFISNPLDRRKFGESKYLSYIVDGIEGGIKNYIEYTSGSQVLK